MPGAGHTKASCRQSGQPFEANIVSASLAIVVRADPDPRESIFEVDDMTFPHGQERGYSGALEANCRTFGVVLVIRHKGGGVGDGIELSSQISNSITRCNQPDRHCLFTPADHGLQRYRMVFARLPRCL